MNENVRTLLNIFSRHSDEMLVPLVEERLQDQDYVHSFRGGQLSVTRNRYVKGGFKLCVEYYMEAGNFICERSEWRKPVQSLILSAEFGPSKRMLNSFVLLAGDGQK